MKITTLEINNIASIDGCYQIDFESEPLNSIGLFAITGATGAGKSTILDAICLALYNKTPRLAPLTSTVQIFDTKDKTISNKDVKTLLRKGAVQGHVKLTFIGIDGKYYRTEWNIRRANNRLTGAIQSEVILLYNLTDEVAFPESRKTFVLAEIERLIGLKYEQFTKSVILAQGEFTSFLKADDNNRADILEKLTGTDIYSKISRKIYEKFKLQKDEVEKINTKLEVFELLSEEQIQELQTSFLALEKQISEMNLKINDSKTILDWYKTEKEIQRNIFEAQKSLDEKREQIQLQQERINRLKTIESFQEIREVVVAFQNQKNDIENNKKTQLDLIQNIDLKEKELNQLNNELNRFNEQISLLQSQINTNNPHYQAARKLDIQLDLEQKNHTDKLQKHTVFEVVLKNLTTDFTNKKSHENQLIQQRNQINNWFEQHRIYETFVSNETLVLAYLKEAEKNRTEIPTEENKINQLVSKRNQLKPVFDKKEETKNLIAEERKEISEQLTAINNQLAKENLSEKEVQLKELTVLKESKNHNIQVLKQLIECRENIETANSKITNTENRISIYNQEIQHLNLSKSNKSIEKETLQKLIERLTIEKSSSVISLRENLKVNEACPVCGSVEHPYAIHNPIEKITNETQTDLLVLENEIQQITAKEAQLKQQIIQLNEIIEELKAIKFKAEIDIQTHAETLHFIDLKKDTNKIYENLLTELDELEKEISERENDLQQLRKLALKKEHFQNKTAEIHHKEQKVNEEIFDLKSEIQQISNQIKSISEHNEIRKTNYSRQIDEVNQLLQNDQWFGYWQQNANEFISDHQQKSRVWKTSMLQLEQISEQQIQLKIEIQELEKSIQDKNKEAEQSKAEISEVEMRLNQIYNDRKTYFNGESVDVIETNLNSNLEKLKHTFEEQKNLQKSLNEQLIEWNSRKNSLIEQLNALELNLQNNFNLIEKWTSSKQILFEDVFEFVKLNTEWLQNERTFIQDLYIKISNCETLLNDRKNALTKHEASNKPLITEEEISCIKSQLEVEIKVLSEQMISNKNQIDNDVKNRNAQNSLIKHRDSLSKILCKWSQLNELIGSADGAKFKKIAQEYTLDILLRYANIHLEKINRRYTLERIPNTLSLQVIDNDMACEIRSVHSLSGGESFLVSLALALALSSLSSSRMNIESLFIDEGFGTLDAQTLAIAMDALESLQNQGKKVGVISHVSEMTERIPVQIHVEKHGNGRSSIEIISF